MTGLLFDVDGVLLDSTAVNVRVWTQWAHQHGLDPKVVVAATPGRRFIDTLQEVAPHLDRDEQGPLFSQLYAVELGNIVAMPGAAELLQALPADAWACVTSAESTWITERFPVVGLPLPAKMVSAEDVDRGKPDPAGYLLGAQRLGRAPEDCLVVEDALAGIAAGHAAGMLVVGLATTHAREEIADADWIYDSLADAAPFLLERVRGR